MSANKHRLKIQKLNLFTKAMQKQIHGWCKAHELANNDKQKYWSIQLQLSTHAKKLK